MKEKRMFIISKSNQELFDKYGLIFEDGIRYYKMPLDKRVFGYDRSSFRRFVMENNTIVEESWGSALLKIVEYLQTKHTKPVEELLAYRTEWSNASIFGTEKFITNSREFVPGLFISVNFSHTHYVWIIQDLLKFYGINPNDCELIVRTPTMGEPEEIKTIYRTLVIEEYKKYLKNKGYDELSIKKCVSGVDTINKVLVKMNCADNDFYLIDEDKTFGSIRNRLGVYNNSERIFNEKQMNTVSKILTLLRESKGFAKK